MNATRQFDVQYVYSFTGDTNRSCTLSMAVKQAPDLPGAALQALESINLYGASSTVHRIDIKPRTPVRTYHGAY